MAKAPERGSFLVFEGCDRSGKTTQIEKIVQRLNSEGRVTRMMRFPERKTNIGQIIHSYLTNASELDDHAVHLLFAANRWELKQEIVDTLMSGTHVIMDRYAYSGVAFSAAKACLNISWCKKTEIGLPKPDMVCFLDVSEEVAKERANFGGERYEVLEFQKKVKENYAKLRDPSWVIVSADGTMEEVEKELYNLVIKEVEKYKEELGKLWVEGKQD